MAEQERHVMNLGTVNIALTEARRFIKAAETWKKAELDKAERHYNNPKESGATRRSSMDLTRALAQLRKSE